MENDDFSTLYDTADAATMKSAYDSLRPGIDRINEIIGYARTANLQTIGIAHCVSFNNEAAKLSEMLETEGFKVVSVNCKYGKMPLSDVVDGAKGIACNPAGQAKYLAENETQLNVMMGLCVGHDMIFNQKSHAPVTPLVVKDRKLKHQTINMLKGEV
jgi:uncharacterized metal-binding protein